MEKATSINFQPCNVSSSERHNSRQQKLDYIFPELSHNNESLCYVTDLKAREKECQALYLEKVGQKMQKKTVPLREGVVVINENTTMDDLKALGGEIKALLGWECLQIHIHRDEGYIKAKNKPNEERKLNLHAHLVFDCQNKETGKMYRIKKEQLSELQTITAKTLKMDRGKPSTRRHLSALEMKIQHKEREFEDNYHKINDLKQELSEYEGTIQVLTHEENSLRAEIEEMKKSIILIQQQLDYERNRLAEIEPQIEAKQKELEEIKKYISDLNKYAKELEKIGELILERNSRVSEKINSKAYILQQLNEHVSSHKVVVDNKIFDFLKTYQKAEEEEKEIIKKQKERPKLTPPPPPVKKSTGIKR